MAPFSGLGSAVTVNETAGKDVLSKFKEGDHFKVVATVRDLSPLAHAGFVVVSKLGTLMYLGVLKVITKDKSELEMKVFSDVLKPFFKKTADEFSVLNETQKEEVILYFLRASISLHVKITNGEGV
jgi:hypothetical protein